MDKFAEMCKAVEFGGVLNILTRFIHTDNSRAAVIDVIIGRTAAHIKRKVPCNVIPGSRAQCPNTAACHFKQLSGKALHSGSVFSNIHRNVIVIIADLPHLFGSAVVPVPRNTVNIILALRQNRQREDVIGIVVIPYPKLALDIICVHFGS